MVEIRRLVPSDVQAAIDLVLAAYARQCEVTPILPPSLMCQPDLALPTIAEAIGNGSVGAFDSGRMTGFMGVSAAFPFKGQTAVLVNELSHAAPAELYGPLYQALGALPPMATSRLHIVAHFAGAPGVGAALHCLGFGAFLAEEVRDLAEVQAGHPAGTVSQLPDLGDLTDIETEHRHYYNLPPMYLRKDCSPESVATKLRKWAHSDTAAFVYSQNNVIRGYFAVAGCPGEDEGRILRNTKSAQLLSAYLTSSARGQGAGRALLSRCITWARDNGYHRMMVEHETANLLGSAFWGRFFSPYLYFVMRYVDVGPSPQSERA